MKSILEKAMASLIQSNAKWKELADSGDCGNWRAEDTGHYKDTASAIEAIRTELGKDAAAQAEPVGWPTVDVLARQIARDTYMGEKAVESKWMNFRANAQDALEALKKLYTTPPSPPAAQAEPVIRACGNCDWQGQTDRICGSIGPLCPDCGETTEPINTPPSPITSAVSDAPLRAIANILNGVDMAVENGANSVSMPDDYVAAWLSGIPPSPSIGGEVTNAAFIRKTNTDYAAWCKTFYQADSLDERGMKSLHGLWAWQEQERRLAATKPEDN